MKYQTGNFKPRNVYTCEENGPRLVAECKNKKDAARIVAALNRASGKGEA